MELDKAILERVGAIKDTDALKKELVLLYGSVAESKETQVKLEKALDEKSVELAKARENSDNALKIAEEIKSNQWSSKYGVKAGPGEEETLYNFGSYLKGIATKNPELVKKYGKNGAQLNPMEENAFGDGQKDFEAMIRNKANLGTPLYSDATTGSYLVPVEYTATVMYIAKQASQMMGQVTEYPMGGITRYVPVQSDAVGFTWRTLQSTATTEADPTFTTATLTSYNAGMYIPIVEEFQEDSLVNVGAYFRDIIGQAWGYEFDYQSLRGSSPFTGIFGAAGYVNTLGNGQTTFDSLTFNDLYTTIQKLTSEMKRVGAKWMMHITILDNLRKIKDANGQYIYQQPSGTQAGSLCGYPYITSDGAIANASTAVSTRFMAFGNPKYFLYGNRIPLEIRVFDNQLNMVNYDTLYFRARVRAAFAVGVSTGFVAVKTAAS
jgi:HK97 family phage major capsid protein